MKYKTLEKELFKPIIRKLRENPSLNFWSIALQQCYKIDEKGIHFSNIEEKKFIEFSNNAIREMERYHRNIASYFIEYGYENRV
ncbi:MAG: hypothetical protein J6S16_01880 [Bacteroidales bacterium]|nr:hypothetical protein [Bacteroidales bacterium]